MSPEQPAEVKKHKRGVRASGSRQTRLRSDRYNANITKRGLVSPVAEEHKETSKPAVSPILIGFLFFVLVGSSVFQIIRMAQTGPIF